MNWIKRLFHAQHNPAARTEPLPKPKHKLKEWTPRQNVSGLDPTLRLQDWRNTDPLVAEMRRFLDTKFGRDVISCLVNECRVQQGIPNPNPQVIGIELGRIAGHQEVIDILMLMAESMPRQENIPVTYAAPEAFRNED